MLEDWFASSWSSVRDEPRPKALGTTWDEARSCHCCLNRSATVRQKLQQAGMELFTQACSFVATLLTKKNPMAIVRVHAEVESRCATHTHARTHVHIWYVVVSDHAHFAASILHLTRPYKERMPLYTRNPRWLRMRKTWGTPRIICLAQPSYLYS